MPSGPATLTVAPHSTLTGRPERRLIVKDFWITKGPWLPLMKKEGISRRETGKSTEVTGRYLIPLPLPPEKQIADFADGAPAAAVAGGEVNMGKDFLHGIGRSH